MTAWTQPVDLYCERLGAHFWAEPVNAVTNLAFILAGIWGLTAIRARGRDGFAEALGWLTVLIGLGSFAFHTDATRLTIWADIIPIAVFVLAYTVFTFERYLGLPLGRAVGATVGFYALTGLAVWLLPTALHQATNGSTGYLPPLLALFFTGALLIKRGHKAGAVNITAGLIFIASATFRILDPVVCASFPLGTHFLWHVLNGLMLGVILTGAAKFGMRGRAGAIVR